MLSEYLTKKNISESFADTMGLNEDRGAIQFPVHNATGELLYSKYRKGVDGQIMMPGGKHSALYGAHLITPETEVVILTEGESDMLAFNSNLIETELFPRYIAVTSTTGVMSFKHKWLEDLIAKHKIYCAFDNDEAGHNGMLKIWQAQTTLGTQKNDQIKFGFVQAPYNDVAECKINELKQSFTTVPEGHQTKHVEFQQVPEPTVYRSPMSVTSQTSDRRIKAKEIPFEDLLPIKRIHGRGRTLCPFHRDTSPSMVLWGEKNLMSCFVCGITMDTIGFLMKRDKLTFYQALDVLVPLPKVQVGRKVFAA